MNELMIHRLVASFAELEKAIASAKLALGKKTSTPPAVMERIATYEEMLNKQRSLFASLCEQAKVENWNEVGRLIKIINGLSEMIRDDAREIVLHMRPNVSVELASETPALLN